MKLPVVIGFGNSLRQDDGLGRKAAQLLEQKLGPGAAAVLECHQLTPELAANLEGAPVVVFFDAAVNQVPGLVRCQNVYPQGPGAWSHNLTPGQLLAVTQHVNGGAP